MNVKALCKLLTLLSIYSGPGFVFAMEKSQYKKDAPEAPHKEVLGEASKSLVKVTQVPGAPKLPPRDEAKPKPLIRVTQVPGAPELPPRGNPSEKPQGLDVASKTSISPKLGLPPKLELPSGWQAKSKPADTSMAGKYVTSDGSTDSAQKKFSEEEYNRAIVRQAKVYEESAIKQAEADAKIKTKAELDSKTGISKFFGILKSRFTTSSTKLDPSTLAKIKADSLEKAHAFVRGVDQTPKKVDAAVQETLDAEQAAKQKSMERHAAAEKLKKQQADAQKLNPLPKPPTKEQMADAALEAHGQSVAMMRDRRDAQKVASSKVSDLKKKSKSGDAMSKSQAKVELQDLVERTKRTDLDSVTELITTYKHDIKLLEDSIKIHTSPDDAFTVGKLKTELKYASQGLKALQKEAKVLIKDMDKIVQARDIQIKDREKAVLREPSKALADTHEKKKRELEQKRDSDLKSLKKLSDAIK